MIRFVTDRQAVEPVVGDLVAVMVERHQSYAGGGRPRVYTFNMGRVGMVISRTCDYLHGTGMPRYEVLWSTDGSNVVSKHFALCDQPEAIEAGFWEPRTGSMAPPLIHPVEGQELQEGEENGISK